MRFLDLNLKTKLITSESTFRRTLCGMVVYKLLKSIVEIDLAFFLTLILFRLVTIGKILLRSPEFLTAWIKKLLLWKLSTELKIILKILDILSESGFVMRFFEATINLALMEILYILGHQYLVGSNLSSCERFRLSFLQ